ncbi:MAG TPA: ABC transporter ATP-binding protein [Clostridia bacterium]|nr:ABC transporter ATP-binding protein [Clostridia bacterium]
MNAIEVRNLVKKYPGFKLDNVSFQLPKGYIMGLVGDNGAGKSTTMKLIMNSIKRDSGVVKVLGCDNTSKSFVKVKEEIGVVLDEALFPEVLNAKQVNNIMKRTYMNWEEDRFFGYMDRFSLPPDKVFKDYSRGMKMKLSISVALSHKSRLLVLDEPTSGLDPIVRDEILDILNEFTRDEENSIVISSHITGDLEKICDYVAFLHKGKFVLCEEKDTLLYKYGIVHATRSEFGVVPKNAIVSKRETPYGIDALVFREKTPKTVKIEKPTIEDIFVFMHKYREENYK